MSLLKVVNEATESVFKRCLTKESCILYSMPDEILIQILLHAVAAEALSVRECTSAIKLSHISSKLRRLLLGVPQLWTAVSSEMASLEMMDAFLTRSEPLPVTFRLFSPDSYQKTLIPFTHVLQRVQRNSYRCSELRVGDADALDELCSICPQLDFQSLKKITLGGVQEGEADYPATWNMPNLTHVSTTTLMSRPPPPSVTSYHIDPWFMDTPEALAVLEHALMLCSTSAIRELKLEMGRTTFESEEPWVRPGHGMIKQLDTLHHLTSLRMDCREPRWAMILPYLDLPNLETLVLRISERITDEPNSFHAFARAFLGSKWPYAKLKLFKFSYLSEYDPEESALYQEDLEGGFDFIDSVVVKMPCLRTLSIDGSYIKPFAYDYIVEGKGPNIFQQLPHLQHLECSRTVFDTEYLVGLARCIRDGPAWPGFKSLSVTQNRNDLADPEATIMIGGKEESLDDIMVDRLLFWNGFERDMRD